MSTIRELIDELNQYSKNNFWKKPPSHPTFMEMLDQYTNYLASLDLNERAAFNAAFWAQIKKIGMPIIEEVSTDEVEVHFLFPRGKYDHAHHKLYIAGDFHGFTSTNDKRQEMHHKVGTDIMYRSDNMPKDSIVSYHFIQVPPAYQNKNRPEIVGSSEALPESFYDILPTTPGEDPLAKNAKVFMDEYSKHWDHIGRLFCANVANDLSQINLMRNTDWEKLFNSKDYLKSLSHDGTYLCDSDNNLIKQKNAANNYLNNIFSNQEYTRGVSVFVPSKSPVNNLIIIHDGVAYMQTGAIERLDSLIGKREIPSDTAVICISPLPGLLEKYKHQSPREFSETAGLRETEFATRIEDYITFIDAALKQLGYGHIPAENKTLIGASMSGTASLYMLFEHRDKFGSAIVQAPTESTRRILFPALQKRKLAKAKGQVEDFTARIQLSCGRFDSLAYAQNLRFAHTEELAKLLGNEDQPLPIHTGNYGHTMCCWSRELTEMLPRLYRQQQRFVTTDRDKSLHRPTLELSSIATIAKKLNFELATSTSIEKKQQDIDETNQQKEEVVPLQPANSDPAQKMPYSSRQNYPEKINKP